jgi:hypothetical protein
MIAWSVGDGRLCLRGVRRKGVVNKLSKDNLVTRNIDIY